MDCRTDSTSSVSPISGASRARVQGRAAVHRQGAPRAGRQAGVELMQGAPAHAAWGSMSASCRNEPGSCAHRGLPGNRSPASETPWPEAGHAGSDGAAATGGSTGTGSMPFSRTTPPAKRQGRAVDPRTVNDPEMGGTGWINRSRPGLWGTGLGNDPSLPGPLFSPIHTYVDTCLTLTKFLNASAESRQAARPSEPKAPRPRRFPFPFHRARDRRVSLRP